jgi:hypothetical protein
MPGAEVRRLCQPLSGRARWPSLRDSADRHGAIAEPRGGDGSDATANARAAAEQFAADSRSELGGIRQANQGVFVILPRDQAPGVNEGAQLQKIVRVVSTVQYFLK